MTQALARIESVPRHGPHLAFTKHVWPVVPYTIVLAAVRDEIIHVVRIKQAEGNESVLEWGK
jgi:hypothetical protein